MTTAEVWERLMANTVQAHLEEAEYQPGESLAPGSGTAGDDPLGIHYADLGPLALILNEAVDATVNRGADRDSLLEQVSEAAGNDANAHDAQAVLAGDVLCPTPELLEGFSKALAIDLEIIIDAAQRGGCTNYGPLEHRPPPGY